MELWHTRPLDQIFAELSASSGGLSHDEAEKRLKEAGPNALPAPQKTSIPALFLSQFNSPLIFVLLAAALATYAIGDASDALIILAVLVFNAVVGTIQEGKAENTLDALRSLVETRATVLRDGKECSILDRDIVVGDVIMLREGEKVPADARVLMVENLKVDESSLTGESEPIYKQTGTIDDTGAQIGDQKNMLFKGTNVVAGAGQAIVVATGLATVIGAIAKEVSSIDTEIPLRTNIKYLSRAIIYVVAVICAALFTIGVLRGEPLGSMFATVVSLSVSIIPEGLPIVMTLVLATGVWRMTKRNALVKKLQAVEALGQARIIAVDKTGTITKNELVVRQVWTAGKLYGIQGDGYEPRGEVTHEDAIIDVSNHPELLSLGKAAALSASAHPIYLEDELRWTVAGDPTEAAMSVFAQKVGFHKERLLSEMALLAEMPFDYVLKFHAVLCDAGDATVLTVVGAPEAIIERATFVRDEAGEVRLSEEEARRLEEVIAMLSFGGQRVIAIAEKRGAGTAIDPAALPELTLLGFVAMKDVLRAEVRDVVARAHEAHVRVVMITGDHAATARAIAAEAGIYNDGDDVMTGRDLDSLSPAELRERIGRTTVFARVTPEHKLTIIRAFKERGEIIAMTGDGVNDAPSLVAADLGVAMGVTGTEVAKEAADMVLLDDNFGSIVAAIEEGRSIYKTIKKVMLYLFSTSLGEVLTITGALLAGLPVPILPAQIIWLNFVTDGFLDVSLAMEPKDKGLLAKTFEKPKRYLIDGLMIRRMITMALPMSAGALGLFALYALSDLEKAWTVSLTVLAVFQWFNAWNCRSETESIFTMNPFSNKYLLGATGLVIALQVLVVYAPFMQGLMRTVPLTAVDWMLIVPVASTIIVAEEIRKFIARRA